MTRIEFAPEITQDFDRIFEHLTEHEVEDAPSRIQDIIAAITVLERNPLIGRPARGDKRELVIGQRARGYVALYRYATDIDTVFVLAVRGQKEAGFERGL
ncbi:MAG: type II toxin-antitoxin system RelE/ParE family toxin [Deltaproteobacteria bacterium]|nr:type II toxin-antitoxin system RelE/ParE family toxin [Deltaproteobacteria bacterium]